MLDELKEFLDIPKNPPKIKKFSTYLSKTKNKSSSKSFDDDLRRLNSSKKVSIMEKIKQRKKKEEKVKKKEYYNNLNKNKKMNLRQFLNRMQNYEQKRKYNIELKKYEKLKKETSSLKEKPKINESSLKLFENLPKEPLYKRTEDILDTKKKMIENLTIYFTLPDEVQKNIKRNKYKNKYKNKYYSAENTKNDFIEYENTIKTSSMENYKLRNKKDKKIEKMTQQKSDEFYNKQEEWYKNIKDKEKYFQKLYQKQNYTYSDITFHPYVSQVSLEILNLKNRANTNNDEFYKYNITNSKSQYGDLYLNNGKTIHDKLYEESLKKNYNNFNNQEYVLNSINYEDTYNNNYNYNLYQKKKNNKFRSVSAKYLDIDKNKKINKNCSYIHQKNFNNKNQVKKNSLKINKSFDDINLPMNKIENPNKLRNLKKLKRKKDDFIPGEEDKYKKNEENDNYQWKNSLLSLKSLPGKSNDYTYHINIRQKGAWDVNLINLITFDKNANTKAIINSIISK